MNPVPMVKEVPILEEVIIHQSVPPVPLPESSVGLTSRSGRKIIKKKLPEYFMSEIKSISSVKKRASPEKTVSVLRPEVKKNLFIQKNLETESNKTEDIVHSTESEDAVYITESEDTVYIAESEDNVTKERQEDIDDKEVDAKKKKEDEKIKEGDVQQQQQRQQHQKPLDRIPCQACKRMFSTNLR